LDLEKGGIIKRKRSPGAVMTKEEKSNANVTPEHACHNPNAGQKIFQKVVQNSRYRREILKRSRDGHVIVIRFVGT
jgi:hypothetical protein